MGSETVLTTRPYYKIWLFYWMKYSPSRVRNDWSKYWRRTIRIKRSARFAEQELAPINSACDRQGCQLNDGQVSLPPSMKTAFQKYAQAGWMGLCLPEQWGGQNQSSRLGSFIGELLTSANHAFSMTPALTISACRVLIAYDSDELKHTYLEKMISGQWTGTMCMTEAHCGSDLGLIRTSATANADGSYQIKGSKIFISAGSHDAGDNIIHLVWRA